MNAALERLVAGEAVTSIALDLGYESVSAFIAMFRRTFSTTPKKFLMADSPSPGDFQPVPNRRRISAGYSGK